MELKRCLCLGEKINKLSTEWNIKNRDHAPLMSSTSDVTIYLNMFGAIIKHRIGSNINNTLLSQYMGNWMCTNYQKLNDFVITKLCVPLNQHPKHNGCPQSLVFKDFRICRSTWMVPTVKLFLVKKWVFRDQREHIPLHEEDTHYTGGGNEKGYLTNILLIIINK